MSTYKRIEVYRPGKAQEAAPFSEGVEYVSKVSTNGMMRIIERLDLEGRRVPVKNVPVGGPDGAEDLFAMFARAKQGLRLLFHMPSERPGEFIPERFLRAVGVSAEDEAARFINEFFPSKKPTEPNEAFAVSVALIFTSTIRRLAQAQAVNFYYLGVTPTDDDPYLMQQSSDWKINTTPENIWNVVEQTHGSLRLAVLQKGFIENPSPLFKAAHFLAGNSSFRRID